MKEVITVRLPDDTRENIELIIKREYPALKTYSDVVREALRTYLFIYNTGHGRMVLHTEAKENV